MLCPAEPYPVVRTRQAKTSHGCLFSPLWICVSQNLFYRSRNWGYWWNSKQYSTSHNLSYHVVSHGCTLCELDMYHYSIGLSVWTSLASIITQQYVQYVWSWLWHAVVRLAYLHSTWMESYDPGVLLKPGMSTTTWMSELKHDSHGNMQRKTDFSKSNLD